MSMIATQLNLKIPFHKLHSLLLHIPIPASTSATLVSIHSS